MEKKHQKALDLLLEDSYWIDSLKAGCSYERRQDDTDGSTEFDQALKVIIGLDSDVYVFPIFDVNGGFRTLRYRNFYGGGQSQRVRNALLILAEAMRRDNEERPQQWITNPPKSN